MRVASLRSLPLDASVIGIAALGLLCLFAWPVAIMAAISVIGLPIFFAMAAVPTLALAVVAWRLSWIALARMGLRSVVASAIVAALVLALPPAVYNARTQEHVEALVAGDRADPIPALNAPAIALRDGLRSRDAVCGDLCRRLLLTGAASRVLVDAAGFKADQAVSAATPAVAFRIEQTGGACPDVALTDSGPTIAIPGERQVSRSAELMRIALAEGRCLLRETARLGDADIVVSEGAVADGRTVGGAGLRPSADTVRGRRLALHVSENGALVERFRRTAVSSAPLTPILIPTYAEMSGLELRPAFLRTTRLVNDWNRQLAPDWAAFFGQTLRIDLSLAALAGRSQPAATAKAVLAREGALPRAATDIADDMFHAVILQNRMTAEQAEAGLALLRDERVPVPYNAWAAIRYGKDIRPGYVQDVGDVLFARLRGLARDPSPPAQRGLRDGANAISNALSSLPDDVILRHREDLVRLAGDPLLRVPAHMVLRRLSVLGADGVPVILRLLEEAAALRAGNPRDFETWQHPYLSAVVALCKMKAAGTAALPALSAALERRAFPAGGSYGRLGLNTLLAIGADPGRARSTMLAAGIEPENLDRQLTRAARSIDCSY